MVLVEVEAEQAVEVVEVEDDNKPDFVYILTFYLKGISEALISLKLKYLPFLFTNSTI